MGSAHVYRGRFGEEEAERLLWRAGFGPRRGDRERLAALGLDGAVAWLTRPPAARLDGPEPRDGQGRPLSPATTPTHDHLWWLDRMVRSNQPLVERMTLVWHDWFATSRADVTTQRAMVDQNQLFRRNALGSFRELLLGVTADPAMLQWLSGMSNTRRAPNENYGREVMELFTLGADRGAYTEADVREQARALTGWTGLAGDPGTFRFEPGRHDPGVKRIFGRRGAFGWRSACDLCLGHRAHPSFFVRKLWSYFVPEPPPAALQQRLERTYRASGHRVRPVVEAILKTPQLYEGPRMTKPAIVFQAGLLRAIGRGVDLDWSWNGKLCGQRLFEPPGVAGWDDQRWLDTSTYAGRWASVGDALRPYSGLATDRSGALPTARALVDDAVAFWGAPLLGRATLKALAAFAERALASATSADKRASYPGLITNGLRMLVPMTPDYQTC